MVMLLVLATSAVAGGVWDGPSLPSTTSNVLMRTSEYDIAEIYQKVELPRDAKIPSGAKLSGNYVFVPTTLSTGKYSVNLTRDSGSGLYRIDGTNCYLELRYCFEYCFSEEVVLVVESNYGFNKGRVVFLK